MNQLIIISVILTLSLQAATTSLDTVKYTESHNQRKNMAKSTASDFASKLNNFNFIFNDVISKESNGNVISSPFSIYSALAMLSVGATDKTKKEIATALGWEEDNLTELLETLKPLYISLLKKDSGATLDVANKAWVGEKTDIRKSYQDNVKKYFDVDIGRADFLNNTESARESINHWVGEKTGGKIENLFSPGSIVKTTKLVLANAVYFKGEWREKFDSEDTTEYDFFLTKSERVRADFMFRHDKIAAALDEEHKMQLLKLPYAGGRFSMIFAIPLANDLDDGGMEFEDLDQVEDKMTNKSKVFDKWVKKLDIKNLEAEVDIFVPKFKVNLSIDLTMQLQQLGINDAFMPGDADFSGINGKTDLYVSSAVHKAFIEVDEEGTIAAAATGMAMNTFSAFQPQEVFLNHPFLFYIIHEDSNAIIFSGKVKNPLN